VLPEDAPDDGVERGIAAFIICANLMRQFEFAQNVWINDETFHELGNEHDPIGSAYFFLPGLNAMRYLAALGT
jgi:deferrochelatase/peroxidase EfeB